MTIFKKITRSKDDMDKFKEEVLQKDKKTKVKQLV